MYFRLVVLLCLFNWSLGAKLALPFIALGTLFIVVGGIGIFSGGPKAHYKKRRCESTNLLAFEQHWFSLRYFLPCKQPRSWCNIFLDPSEFMAYGSLPGLPMWTHHHKAYPKALGIS